MKTNFMLACFLLGCFFSISAAADTLIDDFDQKLKVMSVYKNNGSMVCAMDPLPKEKDKALKLSYHNQASGYSGVYFPMNQNWDGATSLKVSTRGLGTCKTLVITLVDAKNRHFINDLKYSDDQWHEVIVPLSAFRLNPNYQPEEVKDLSGGLMLGQIKQMQFSVTQPGEGDFWVKSITVLGLEPKSFSRKSPPDRGVYIYYQPKLDFSKLEKYYLFSDRIELGSQNQLTAGAWQGFRSLSATIYLQADAAYFYISALVSETEPVYNNKTRGAIWNGDCLELFLGLGRTRGHTYGPMDFQIGMSAGTETQKPVLWVFNLNRTLKTYDLSVKPMPNGYTLKARIPVRELGLNSLRDGQQIFIDAAIDKAGPDGNRTAQLTWHGKGLGYLDPMEWDRAVIASNRSEAVNNLKKVIKDAWLRKQKAEVVIDGQKILNSVNPNVYGMNVFPSNETPAGWMDYSPSAMARYQKLLLALLRFPGGNWGDEHKLTRPQIDKFIGLCQDLKSEPMIQARLHDGTPEEAASLVNYCNVQKKYNVKYWCVGNEPDYFETQHFIDKPYRVKDYVRDFKAFARAMKKADPNIKILGPELANYYYSSQKPDEPLDKDNKSWMETFLQECGNEVDIVTFHHYPMGVNNALPDWRTEALLMTTNRWQTLIPGLRQKINTLTGRDIPIGVTEINSDWSGLFNGEATAETFANAIWWTVSMGEMMKQQVDMVCFFAIYDTGSYGIVTKDLDVLPAYYTYEMFKGFGNQMIEAQSSNEYLKIYAGRSREDGKHFQIIFVNKETDLDIQAAIRFKGIRGVKRIRVERLSEYDHANRQDFFISDMNFREEKQYIFPRFSMTKFILE